MRRLNGLVVVALLAVIGILVWVLVAKPAPEEVNATTTPNIVVEPTSTSTNPTVTPLSERVKVISPVPNSRVTHTFTVSGEAPGPWYFEASFPMQVRDAKGNKVGQIAAHAEGDWMTDGQVPFSATITVTGYSGPATLILLKDNPSGMPENDDSVSFPIVIQ